MAHVVWRLRPLSKAVWDRQEAAGGMVLGGASAKRDLERPDTQNLGFLVPAFPGPRQSPAIYTDLPNNLHYCPKASRSSSGLVQGFQERLFAVVWGSSS